MFELFKLRKEHIRLQENRIENLLQIVSTQQSLIDALKSKNDLLSSKCASLEKIIEYKDILLKRRESR